MPFRVAALIALVVAGALLGAVASGGFVSEALAGQHQHQPLRYHDPLPR